MPKPLAEQVDKDNAIRQQREHDRELGKLKTQLAQSEQKRKQAEADLDVAYERVEFIRDTECVTPAGFDYVKRKPSGSATAVVVLTDWHAEETVDPATIDNANRYDLKVCEQRVRKVVQKVPALLEAERKMSNIRDLVLALLGDMMTGMIHEDLAETNGLSPTEAVIFCQDLIAGAIDYLLKHADVKTILIPTNHGNHGRTTLKPRCSTSWKHSYEWMMYKQLERVYRNEPRVTWKVEKGVENYLEIQGKTVRFHHGDTIKYSGGVGGISIPVNKRIAQWNKRRVADYDFFGHWHQHERHRNWAACNCLIGYNAYAVKIGAEYSEPSQTLAVFDKGRPKPVSVREIFCD